MSRPDRAQAARLSTVIGVVLRTGTVLAAMIILLGLALLWAGGSPAPLALHHFDPSAAQSGTHVLTGLSTFEPRAVILLGVVVLVLTPLLRVLSCTVVFLMERDRLYVVISLIVAATLLLGMLGVLA